MKIKIITLLMPIILIGCSNQPPLQHRLNDAYHRGYCDGRLYEIEFSRTNSIEIRLQLDTNSSFINAADIKPYELEGYIDKNNSIEK